MDKKLNKLVKAGHIIKKKGVGKHYHKVWYSPSRDMITACTGKNFFGDRGKVYYNPRIAEEDVNASVVYAAIMNLLKLDEGFQKKEKPGNPVIGKDLGKVGDTLTLNYAKLAEGSGLSIKQVRKAVAWLIEHKKIEAKSIFGNKKRVWLPPNQGIPTSDLPEELPTESHPHTGDDGKDLTEY